MSKVSLKRMLRGQQSEVLDQMQLLVDEPFCVQDARGKVIFGEAPEDANTFPVLHEGKEIGIVSGSAEAEQVARILELTAIRQAEKRALADETLERYKELTLLYEMSESLSTVLDVNVVAERVVAEAQKFLKGVSTVLMLRTGSSEALEPFAFAGAYTESSELEGESSALRERVLESGRAELKQTDDGLFLCAPLRDGERVVGMICACHTDPTAWTAAELKLLTSLGATASGAISHAMLHQGQLRSLARRSDIARFVSPELAQAAVGTDVARKVAVIFCDLNGASNTILQTLEPDAEQKATNLVKRKMMKALLALGGTFNLTENDMIVCVFAEKDFESSVRHAHSTAVRMLEIIAESDPHGALSTLGIGITQAHTATHDQFMAGVEMAAELQALAEKRIFIDRNIAAILGGEAVNQIESQDDGEHTEVFEVPA